MATAAQQGWYVDRAYDVVIVQPAKAFARLTADVVDGTVIDGAVNGVGGLVKRAASGGKLAPDRVRPHVCARAVPRRGARARVHRGASDERAPAERPDLLPARRGARGRDRRPRDERPDRAVAHAVRHDRDVRRLARRARAVRSREPRVPDARTGLVGAEHRPAVRGRGRRDQLVARPFDHVPVPGVGARVVDGDHRRPPLHDRDAGPRDRRARDVPRAGPDRVLHLLRGDLGPDVPADRRVGRRAPRLRRGEVLPLHDGRLGVPARVDPVPLRAHGRDHVRPAVVGRRVLDAARRRPRDGCSSGSSSRSR